MKHMNEFGDFRFLKLIFLRVVESAEVGILLVRFPNSQEGRGTWLTKD